MRGVSFWSFMRAGHLGLVELAAADAQQRQDRHRQHDDAQAARPTS
jgi:hypothetical protein